MICEIAVVGFGPHEKILKQKVQDLALQKKVIFSGRIEHQNIYSYMKSVDLFLHASKIETQGLAISEAKACGKPTVAIEAIGVTDMIVDGEDGFLVTEDQALFCERVLYLINNKNVLESFSANAARNAQAHYLNSIITQKLSILLYELVGKN